MRFWDRPFIRRALLGVAVFALVGIAFIVGRGVGADARPPEEARPAIDRQEDEPAHEDGSYADQSETTYYCSMHPEQRSTDPDATCPICGMDLVPMPDDAADDDGDLPVLRLSERSARLLDIETMPAERRPAEAELRFVGKLEPDERRTVEVVARSDSYIETLHANFTWHSLEAGEPIAALYSPQVDAAARELLIAHRRDNPDTRNAARAKLRRLGVSADQIDAILEAGEVTRTYEMHAPRAGVVNELGGLEGRWLAEGELLIELIDLSNLWLQLEAYESDLQWLRTGQVASFTVQARPGQTFEGEVSFIDPVVDPRTRTARVRLDVPNPDDQLKPGMFARGTVRAEVPAEAERGGAEAGEPPPLLIPRTAPLITGKRAIVYVRRPDTDRPTFEARPITLGPRVGEHYVVRDGLETGERVVTHGQFKLDSELQIRGRPSMMARAELFEQHEPDDDAPRVPTDHPAHDIDPAAVPASLAQDVRATFEAYQQLTDALANDDFGAAQDAAHAYHDQLLAMSTDALDEEVREAWDAVDRSLHESLHAMAAAESIEGIRSQLEPLSDHTALAVQAFAPELVGSLHRMHCPMAFDNRGADWFQTVREVRNPYFGDEMLRCGEVTETLLDADARETADEPAARTSAPQTTAEGDGPNLEAVAADYPLDECVVSGLALGAMGGPVAHEHDGQTVLFCCDACLPDFNEEPRRHLEKLEAARE